MTNNRIRAIPTIPDAFDRMSHRDFDEQLTVDALRDLFKALKEIRCVIVSSAGIPVHLCHDCYAIYPHGEEHVCNA